MLRLCYVTFVYVVLMLRARRRVYRVIVNVGHVVSPVRTTVTLTVVTTSRTAAAWLPARRLTTLVLTMMAPPAARQCGAVWRVMSAAATAPDPPRHSARHADTSRSTTTSPTDTCPTPPYVFTRDSRNCYSAS